MSKSEIYRIKVLDKVFKILALFDVKNKSLTVQEVSELLGYNKSSTYRIMCNLEAVAYIERLSGTQKYKLGFGVYTLGTLAESYGPIRNAANRHLLKLNNECDETVQLAVFSHGQALYIDKIDSKKRVLRIVSRVGATLPCHCSGVGKILFSSLTDKELSEVLGEWGLPKQTDNTITDSVILREELQRVRQQGYAIDNEEIDYGLKCIAAPIYDARGKIVAAMSISAPKERFNQEFNHYRDMILATAQAISDDLSVDYSSHSNDNLKLTTCDNRILTTLSGERKAG